MFKLLRTATASATGFEAGNHSSAAVHPATEHDTIGKAADFVPNEFRSASCAAQVPRRETAT